MKKSISRLSPLTTLGALGAIALLPLLAACDDPAASAAATAERPVQVQRVAFENENPVREFVGVVRARHETDLGFRVAGKIVSRNVNVGDLVRVGDVVARLDPMDLELQVESARSELAAATSNLAQTSVDELRYAGLKARGYAAVADYERKKVAKDEAEGRLEHAQRALDLANNQLAYAELRADADGVITATPAEPGQVVNVGQAVARLAHRGEKEAVVALPESFVGAAQQSEATVSLWADPGRSFPARLRELSPRADDLTRTYGARFTIDDPDDKVVLGMTATVRLALASDAQVAKLPLAAILNRGTGASVYLVDAASALVLRPVTVASFSENAALVTAGISDGDRVVTLGVQKLTAGARVRAIETH